MVDQCSKKKIDSSSQAQVFGDWRRAAEKAKESVIGLFIYILTWEGGEPVMGVVELWPNVLVEASRRSCLATSFGPLVKGSCGYAEDSSCGQTISKRDDQQAQLLLAERVAPYGASVLPF
jgi:hypothetical protein